MFLASEIVQEMKPYADSEGTLLKKEGNKESIQEAINFLQQQNNKAAILLHKNPEVLLKEVKEEFTVIVAAGGFVSSTEGSVLMIFRKGKWDLPKGKLDPGEDLETCAVREVEEETGLQNVHLEQPLNVTYHTYYQDGQFCLKESHWYLMTTAEGQVFTPQTDEDIERCEWVKREKLSAYLENTYPAIIDVVKKGLPLLKKQING